jgi:hypothetical protein
MVQNEGKIECLRGTHVVYLAAPYSHKDQSVREYRAKLIDYAMSLLVKLGIMVYSPISHCHSMVTRHDMDGGYDYWAEYNAAMIARCDAMYVLTIPGWADSVGVTEEIKFAKSIGMEVRELDFTFDQFDRKGDC